jgi:flagellar FliL protein
VAEDKASTEAEAGGKKKKKGVLLLGGAGGGAWYYLNAQKASEEGEEEVVEQNALEPIYLAMEPMVVNLADMGGDRMAQVGITLQVREEKMLEPIRKVMPTIRSSILLNLSQKTAQDLLTKAGKEQLASEILALVGLTFGVQPPPVVAPGEELVEEEKPKGKKSKKDEKPKKSAPEPQNPVVNVLFSSLIVQ